MCEANVPALDGERGELVIFCQRTPSLFALLVVLSYRLQP